MPSIIKDKAKISISDKKTYISSGKAGVNSTGHKQLFDSELLFDSGITFDDYNGSPVDGERAKISLRSD